MPYKLLNENLPNLVKTRKIVPVNDNLFWFITDKEYFAVKFKNGVYSIQDRIAFNTLLNPSTEQRATIFVDERGNSYFCLNEGIALYHFTINSIRRSAPPLILSSLKSYNRNTDQWTQEQITNRMSFDYAKNNLVFELQYPNFSQQNYRLQYYLENYDKRWNENNSDFIITYQNIPQGKYFLKTKIVNELNQEIATYQIPFEITTPWYKSAKASSIKILSAKRFYPPVIRSVTWNRSRSSTARKPSAKSSKKASKKRSTCSKNLKRSAQNSPNR